VITNDARCTREIKSRIAMARAAFDRRKTHSFHLKIGLEFKKENNQVIAAAGTRHSMVLKLGRFYN
jgi:hypothetical protein